ncbi:MAG: hypothetical protein PF692_12495, partial [Kiritimatiellae bacterium]|nr:hypothetical protein [Kiritimatiellia bacterium]
LKLFSTDAEDGIPPCLQYNIKLHNGRVSVPADRKGAQPKNQDIFNKHIFVIDLKEYFWHITRTYDNTSGCCLVVKL